MSNTNIRPWKQGPLLPAEFTAAVDRMTNWERSRWMKAGQPGAVDGSVEKLGAFLTSLPRRFEKHPFSLIGTGKVSMRKMLEGRTGIDVVQLGERTAVVEATGRMIDRLVRRFHYCLGAEIIQPSGE